MGNGKVYVISGRKKGLPRMQMGHKDPRAKGRKIDDPARGKEKERRKKWYFPLIPSVVYHRRLQKKKGRAPEGKDFLKKEELTNGESGCFVGRGKERFRKCPPKE